MDSAIPTTEQANTSVEKDAGRLADFVMFVQRSFLLNLTKELNKANVSHTQFFLLGYLAKDDYLTTTDIAKKMLLLHLLLMVVRGSIKSQSAIFLVPKLPNFTLTDHTRLSYRTIFFIASSTKSI